MTDRQTEDQLDRDRQIRRNVDGGIVELAIRTPFVCVICPTCGMTVGITVHTTAEGKAEGMRITHQMIPGRGWCNGLAIDQNPDTAEITMVMLVKRA